MAGGRTKSLKDEFEAWSAESDWRRVARVATRSALRAFPGLFVRPMSEQALLLSLVAVASAFHRVLLNSAADSLVPEMLAETEELALAKEHKFGATHDLINHQRLMMHDVTDEERLRRLAENTPRLSHSLTLGSSAWALECILQIAKASARKRPKNYNLEAVRSTEVGIMSVLQFIGANRENVYTEDDEDRLWVIVSHDRERAATPALLEEGIWPGTLHEPEIIRRWSNLPHPQLLRGDWSVWLGWYDSRLRGGPIDLELERVYASMEPSWLEKGAAAYNSELKRRLDELAERRKQDAPQEDTVPEITSDALPEQTPRGARFDAPPAGPIRLADFAPPVDGLVDGPEQQEDWEDIREKARAVRALGPNRVPDDLAEKVDRVLALDARLGTVRAQRLWSCFSSLRIALDDHEAGAAAEIRTGEPDPRTLNGETAGKLADLVGTYNTFTLEQPKLLERDAARPGPRDVEEMREAARQIAPMIREAARNREITTEEAGEVLLEAQAALERAPETLPERQAATVAAATQGNLFIRFLRKLSQIVIDRLKLIETGLWLSFAVTYGEDMLAYARSALPSVADHVARIINLAKTHLGV